MKFLILLTSVVASSWAFADYDPSKKTICAMTLHSDSERRAFQESLEDFNVVELVNESDEWLEQACYSNRACDVVVVSGHFAGVFFGRTDHKLSLERLETHSCRRECDGLFRSAKRVFLFGANTMADGRGSSGDFERSIRRSGVSRAQARQATAFASSPWARVFRDRLTRVFPNALIHGFTSVAPQGRESSRKIQEYLDSVGSFAEHLSHSSGRDEELAEAFQGTGMVTVRGSSGGENPACHLMTPWGDDVSKLRWIQSSLKTPRKRLELVSLINMYLQQVKKEQRPWGEPEIRILDEIAADTETRSAMMAMLSSQLKELPSVQLNVATLAMRLQWMTPSAYRSKVKEILGVSFADNISRDDRERICSMDTEIDLVLEQLPPRPWDSSTLRAIECMRPTDLRLPALLLGILRDTEEHPNHRGQAARVLGALAVNDSATVSALVEALDERRGRVRSGAAAALEKIKPSDIEVLRKIQEKDERLARRILEAQTRRQILR